MNNPVLIGKGLARVRVRSRKKREKLAKVHEIRVEGDRVIVPVSLIGAIMSALAKGKRRTTADAIQTSVEFGEKM